MEPFEIHPSHDESLDCNCLPCDQNLVAILMMQYLLIDAERLLASLTDWTRHNGVSQPTKPWRDHAIGLAALRTVGCCRQPVAALCTRIEDVSGTPGANSTRHCHVIHNTPTWFRHAGPFGGEAAAERCLAVGAVVFCAVGVCHWIFAGDQVGRAAANST